MPLDPLEIRKAFPIYRHFARLGEPFVYLDNAATTQKPDVVIDAETGYYREFCANVHRSPHKLGEEATNRLEAARNSVAQFLNIDDPAQVIFSSGTTGSINLIANIIASQVLKPGDVILLTPSEHHSNLVPWQMAAARYGAVLQFIDIFTDGTIDYASIQPNWNPRTKVFAFQHASNVTGAIHDVSLLTKLARQNGAISVIDGAQAAPHLPLDLQTLDADFYAFSGHKCVGPTGIGVLYGRRELLEHFSPVFGGGEMILKVQRHSSTYNDLPYKFEPGTPNVAGIIGLGAAVEYLMAIGLQKISTYIDDLAEYAIAELTKIDGLTLVGPLTNRTGAISFNLAGCHPHDIASILDHRGISIRAGVHCAEPLMECLAVPSTARASFYFYNTHEEVDQLVDALKSTREILGL